MPEHIDAIESEVVAIVELIMRLQQAHMEQHDGKRIAEISLACIKLGEILKHCTRLRRDFN